MLTLLAAAIRLTGRARTTTSDGSAMPQTPTTVNAFGGWLSNLLTNQPSAHTCSMGPIVACDEIGIPHAVQKCDLSPTSPRQCGQ